MVNQVKGFTLIEVLMVVVIVAILSATAIIGFERIITGMRLGQHRDYILAFVQEAKALAITSYPHGLRISGDHLELLRLDGDNGNFQYDTGETFTVVKSGPSLPSGYAVAYNQCTTDNILWFDRKGFPKCSDWSMGITSVFVKKDSSISNATCQGSDGTSLTTDDDRRCKSVVIDQAGRVRFEK